MKVSSKKIKKSFLLSLKITLILTGIFTVIFNQFTLKGIVITFLISLMYTFILGFGQGVINDFLSSKYDWVSQNNKRVWSGIFATILYTVPAVLITNYILFIEIQGLDKSLFFKNQYFWIHLFYILISFLISSFLHARSFMLEWKKATKQETQQHKIIAKNESAKFETLKNQIDPHFLFNSLNVLTSLIGENPNRAEKFTTKLSKVYRYVLEQRNKELVPIAEELKFAKTYMELLQMRFEDAIIFEIATEISDSDLKVVPLSLQLLLENTVKHNVVSSSNPLHVKVYEESGFLKVENNKNLKQILNEKSTKIGLQNIYDRYSLISSKQIKIINNNEVFSVSLPMLKQKENIMETRKTTQSIDQEAKEHVAELKAFYSHLITYLIFCVFIIFINLQFSPRFHWFWFAILGWGIGVISHALRTFEIPFFGKSWEKKQEEKYIKKHK